MMINALENPIDQSRGSVDHALDSKRPNGHLCDLMFDQAEFCDRLAKLKPLLRIGHRILQCILRCPDTPCAQLETTNVQRVKSDDMAFPNFPEDILHGYLGIREDDAPCGGPL